nr:type II toxin-antitoxin system RelE/ParE family toxin [Thiocystis violacea]
MLNAAQRLDDLRLPPANRLESLSGNRAEQHRLRINEPWRICLAWNNGNAGRVKMCDDH